MPAPGKSNERAVQWSTESAIPIPQVCPAGQFVMGIDSGGQLTCATPGTPSGGGGAGGGGCTGEVLSFPNATGVCDPTTGQVYIECDPGFYDIKGNVSDGCEYEPVLNPGPEVCDGQDNDADGQVDEGVSLPSYPNAETTCQQGSIVVNCQTGFTDANEDLSDGCETSSAGFSPTVESPART
jgi:hypothetical protein